MKTLRYESINATNGNQVTFLDDLQSLGFVITEALFGPNMCGEGSRKNGISGIAMYGIIGIIWT